MKVKMFFRAFLSAFMVFIFFNFALAEEITAPSAVAVDAQTGKILYGKNPHLKLAPASTTKLVTAMVALENLSPEKKVKISNKAAKTQSVSPKLTAGEIYTVRDLVYLALMRSVNSATVALAEAVSGNEKDFVKLMNDKVKKIGANDTRFVNSSGLPGKGQYTTAYDLTKIMAHALSYPLIKEAINTRVYLVRSEEGREHFIQNTNHLLWSEDNMIGGKTGYTRTAKHCFVSASRVGNRLIYTAVLGEANRDKLWQDTQQLIVKADTILSGKGEPIVHLTEEKPIVKASYKSVNNIAEKQKIKSKKTSKNKGKKLKNKRTKNASNNTKSI
ncbi:D-alanyl-D-alanine carboxypeptidase [Thermodesulfovibrio sp. N1]|uniref:D-alanyl-D-alanine carboxypeptidase family protein n=1 Tax=unclassified Thermodesulfovibrio TaxID=2645936 RepID=UPI00083A29C1|nr:MULTISPECIES: D-alanyl-D-alanine carboxypeptidase family protein [unclassified Thermodesulfovibrio]MDI1472279.1 D-alanyl-D-alanine carboxypeptidase family protein [Thermodesulfovibrio sp. 1176]ODA44955.1 D-alanyl-D-alanine carboxypeptidase [Thermodesulfovibrio sp. N1]